MSRTTRHSRLASSGRIDRFAIYGLFRLMQTPGEQLRNTMTNGNDPERYTKAIRTSGLTIYDSIKIGDPQFWIPALELELLLNSALVGVSLAGLPLRTRSKVVKERVCQALGYPVPSSFKKTRPRFPGQFFDIHIQKSNNLQIWNEVIIPSRRYAIVRVEKDSRIVKVKVVTGDTLNPLDTTGTLTQKYQARLYVDEKKTDLVTFEDTKSLQPFIQPGIDLATITSPTNHPRAKELLPIDEIFDRLKVLVGKNFPDVGYDQERKRGGILHRLVCQHLGYGNYRDDGQFPDVRHQLLEVKLQTSLTIDLGLVRPDSEEALDKLKIEDYQIRHCDVRYVLFYGTKDEEDTRQLHNLPVRTSVRPAEHEVLEP